MTPPAAPDDPLTRAQRRGLALGMLGAHLAAGWALLQVEPVRKSTSAPMADINMVPLIDVMLVLLVIFIVTAPLLTHAVKLELPRASAQPHPPPPDKIDFAIDAAGQRYWNGESLTRAQAAERFAAEGRRTPQPEVHLRADQATAYRHVAETPADASKAGLAKVGFVSEPDKP